jgi:hypothetical protein
MTANVFACAHGVCSALFTLELDVLPFCLWLWAIIPIFVLLALALSVKFNLYRPHFGLHTCSRHLPPGVGGRALSFQHSL